MIGTALPTGVKHFSFLQNSLPLPQNCSHPIKGVTSIDIEDGNLIDIPPPVLGDGNVLLNVFPYCSFDENVSIWVSMS